MHKLNPHSRLPSFYRYFYLKGELPNNLCNYFWGLVLAFICLPFVFPAMVINRYNKQIYLRNYNGKDYYEVSFNPIPTLAGAFFNIVLFIIGGLVMKGISIISLDTFQFINTIFHAAIPAILFLLAVGIITSLIAVVLFVGIIRVFSFISKLIEKDLTPEERKQKREADFIKLMEKEDYKKNNPSFLVLTWRWMVAFKEKNCPMITWDYNEKNG